MEWVNLYYKWVIIIVISLIILLPIAYFVCMIIDKISYKIRTRKFEKKHKGSDSNDIMG